MHSPVGRVGRHHVQVTVDEQGGPTRVCALDPRHHARPSAVRFEDGGLQPCLGEESRDMLGGDAFARSGVVARIARVDPDQVACQRGDLVLRCAAASASGWDTVAHLAIVAPSVPRGGSAIRQRIPASLLAAWLANLGLRASFGGRRPWVRTRPRPRNVPGFAIVRPAQLASRATSGWRNRQTR